jgi:hypothetical protein
MSSPIKDLDILEHGVVSTNSNGDLENQAMTRELCSTATERWEVNLPGSGGRGAEEGGWP